MRFFRRRNSDSEIDAELQYHLDQQTALYVREGMPELEARRRVLAEFGSFTGIVAGAALLLGIAPALRLLLTAVQPSNPWFMAAAAALLLLVAAVAMAYPAWRVRRLEPALVLRHD